MLEAAPHVRCLRVCFYLCLGYYSCMCESSRCSTDCRFVAVVIVPFFFFATVRPQSGGAAILSITPAPVVVGGGWQLGEVGFAPRQKQDRWPLHEPQTGGRRRPDGHTHSRCRVASSGGRRGGDARGAAGCTSRLLAVAFPQDAPHGSQSLQLELAVDRWSHASQGRGRGNPPKNTLPTLEGGSLPRRSHRPPWLVGQVLAHGGMSVGAG